MIRWRSSMMGFKAPLCIARDRSTLQPVRTDLCSSFVFFSLQFIYLFFFQKFEFWIFFPSEFGFRFFAFITMGRWYFSRAIPGLIKKISRENLKLREMAGKCYTLVSANPVWMLRNCKKRQKNHRNFYGVLFGTWENRKPTWQMQLLGWAEQGFPFSVPNRHCLITFSAAKRWKNIYFSFFFLCFQ